MEFAQPEGGWQCQLAMTKWKGGAQLFYATKCCSPSLPPAIAWIQHTTYSVQDTFRLFPSKSVRAGRYFKSDLHCYNLVVTLRTAAASRFCREFKFMETISGAANELLRAPPRGSLLSLCSGDIHGQSPLSWEGQNYYPVRYKHSHSIWSGNSSLCKADILNFVLFPDFLA